MSLSFLLCMLDLCFASRKYNILLPQFSPLFAFTVLVRPTTRIHNSSTPLLWFQNDQEKYSEEKNQKYLLDFSLSNAALYGSHGLSARRAWWTKSSRPEKPPSRSLLVELYILVPTLLPGVRPAHTLLLILATLGVGEEIPLAMFLIEMLKHLFFNWLPVWEDDLRLKVFF